MKIFSTVFSLAPDEPQIRVLFEMKGPNETLIFFLGKSYDVFRKVSRSTGH